MNLYCAIGAIDQKPMSALACSDELVVVRKEMEKSITQTMRSHRIDGETIHAVHSKMHVLDADEGADKMRLHIVSGQTGDGNAFQVKLNAFSVYLTVHAQKTAIWRILELPNVQLSRNAMLDIYNDYRIVLYEDSVKELLRSKTGRNLETDEAKALIHEIAIAAVAAEDSGENEYEYENIDAGLSACKDRVSLFCLDFDTGVPLHITLADGTIVAGFVENCFDDELEVRVFGDADKLAESTPLATKISELCVAIKKDAIIKAEEGLR